MRPRVSLPDPYRTPSAAVQVEETIRRSRFVTRLARTVRREDVDRLLGDARSRLPGASHYARAWILGHPASPSDIGASDGGEVPGTAGKPMLRALQASGLGDIAAVCVRYYGGVRLGTAGLARAYARGVRRAAAECPTLIHLEERNFHVRVAYSKLAWLERQVDGLGGRIIRRVFREKVRVLFRLPLKAEQELLRRLSPLNVVPRRSDDERRSSP